MLKSGRWQVVLGLLVCWFVLSAGACRRNNPTPVAVVPIQPIASETGGAAAEEAPAVEVAAPVEEPAAAVVEEKAAPEPPAKPVSKERMLLLAPGNPLVVELHLTIDDQPHTEALVRLVDEVLKLGDTDGDGRTMWKELCASRRVKYGQYGNLAIDNDNSEKQVIERYDIARDGVVDRHELPRFLTRNAGGSRPFSIRGTLDFRDLNRRGAATWRVIDADADGAISAEERAAAPLLLAGRDNDDDEILLAADLNPRLQTPDPEMMADRRRRGPDAARLLGPHADWGGIQRMMEVEYGGGRALTAESFPLTPELFTQLDGNKDGKIRRDEFAVLNDVPAHVVVEAAFGKHSNPHAPREENVSRSETTTTPRLKLVHVASELAGRGNSVVEQSGRLTIAVGGSRLTFYTNDTVASEDFSERAKQSLGMFDQNKDGYLEKSEETDVSRAQLGRFEALDADDDGKAYAHEIEAFLAQQQAGLRAQIHAKAADTEDVLFAALDADHDERLDSRELEGAALRLAAFDKNGDGKVVSDELPEVLLIGLARGSLENAEATFRPPPIIVRGPDGKAPRWFTSMDANQDGVISKREFLGAAEVFRGLDKSGDGLLETSEIVSTAEGEPTPQPGDGSPSR
jgi:Ca2+-binding EF-hand superfamily protein